MSLGTSGAWTESHGRWQVSGNDWTDLAPGEMYSSSTMLTINCDEHPLLSRMHKPDPRLEPHLQDKRTVVPIE